MILNRPICHKPECNNQALLFLNRMWVCGDCFVKLQEKIDKLKESLLIEE